MKKIAIALCLLIGGSVYQAHAAGILRIEIDFGRPSTKGNCEGMGICKIILGNTATLSTSLAEAFLTENGHELTVRIPENYFAAHQPEQLANFLGKSSFRLDQDFIGDDKLSRALKMVQPLVIKKGAYPMLREQGNYVVRFAIDGK